MTAHPFQGAMDAAAPHFTLGQLLGPDELPASPLSTLSPPQRRALVLALDEDRLDWLGRLGWHKPGSRITPAITDETIHALAARGLLRIVARGRFRKHARITARGQWFARTLNSELHARLKGVLK